MHEYLWVIQSIQFAKTDSQFDFRLVPNAYRKDTVGTRVKFSSLNHFLVTDSFLSRGKNHRKWMIELCHIHKNRIIHDFLGRNPSLFLKKAETVVFTFQSKLQMTTRLLSLYLKVNWNIRDSLKVKDDKYQFIFAC